MLTKTVGNCGGDFKGKEKEKEKQAGLNLLLKAVLQTTGAAPGSEGVEWSRAAVGNLLFWGGRGEREQGESTTRPGELMPEEQVTSLKSLGLAKMRCDQRGSWGSSLQTALCSPASRQGLSVAFP